MASRIKTHTISSLSRIARIEAYTKLIIESLVTRQMIADNYAHQFHGSTEEHLRIFLVIQMYVLCESWFTLLKQSTFVLVVLSVINYFIGKNCESYRYCLSKKHSKKILTMKICFLSVSTTIYLL